VKQLLESQARLLQSVNSASSQHMAAAAAGPPGRHSRLSASSPGNLQPTTSPLASCEQQQQLQYQLQQQLDAGKQQGDSMGQQHTVQELPHSLMLQYSAPPQLQQQQQLVLPSTDTSCTQAQLNTNSSTAPAEHPTSPHTIPSSTPSRSPNSSSSQGQHADSFSHGGGSLPGGQQGAAAGAAAPELPLGQQQLQQQVQEQQVVLDEQALTIKELKAIISGV